MSEIMKSAEKIDKFMAANAIQIPTVEHPVRGNIRNNEFWINGIEGRGVVHERSRQLLVVKMPGGQHWSGRGMQSYHRTSFAVYKIEEATSGDDVEYLRVRKIIEFDIRK